VYNISKNLLYISYINFIAAVTPGKGRKGKGDIRCKTQIEADPIQYPDTNNQYGDYMIFETSGIGEEPTEEPCLDYNELNYYLSKFDYIKNYNKPSNKSFKSIYVYDDFALGITYWIRRHFYELYYATPITSLPD
jgi:hypothetical protein